MDNFSTFEEKTQSHHDELIKTDYKKLLLCRVLILYNVKLCILSVINLVLL